MTDKKTSIKEKILILNNKKFLIYLIAFASSILTFIFFMFARGIIIEEKTVVKQIDIYKVAKEEAIKLGRIETDVKKKIKEIGPDGKVIKPSLSYIDIGGMGPNSNKSFVTNITKSNSFISFDLAFSSYEGEDLSEYLTDFDADLRAIVFDQVKKQSVSELLGSKGKNLLLDNIKNGFNEYFIKKELEPVVHGAHFKVVVINKR